jgi:hypothetical protein
VAERVVDELKAVEVEEQHGGAGLGRRALGAADRLAEPVEEQHAVGQAGQGVVQRVVLEALLGLLAVGHVGLAADDADRPPLGVADGHPARQHPAVGAVAVLDPVLVLEVVARAGEVGVERLAERRPVVDVDAAEPLAGRVADLPVLVAEHRLPAGGEVEPVLAHVPVPEAVVGALHGERVALLGLGQAGERGLVGDRVAQRPLECLRVGHVVRDARLGGRDVGLAVVARVEQEHRRVGGAGEDRPGELQAGRAGILEVGVDQVRVVRLGVGEGLLGRRDVVDLVDRPADRLERLPDGRMGGHGGLHHQYGHALGERAHAASCGSSAASSQ